MNWFDNTEWVLMTQKSLYSVTSSDSSFCYFLLKPHQVALALLNTLYEFNEKSYVEQKLNQW